MSPKNSLEIEFELSNEELQTMSGAMTCQKAIDASNVLVTIGGLLGAWGDSVDQLAYTAQAAGMVQGACSK